MSPFVYRLEKVLKYRINKREEQRQKVIRAQQEVARIQAEIDKNKGTVVSLRQTMFTANHTLLDSYDRYIKYLHDLIEQLEVQKFQAQKKLEEEIRILEELEKGINALEKHKEKAYEVYKEERKKAELKVLNEVGAQKHFIKMREKLEEEEIENQKIIDEEEY